MQNAFISNALSDSAVSSATISTLFDEIAESPVVFIIYMQYIPFL